jgi:hypothetical protein
MAVVVLFLDLLVTPRERAPRSRSRIDDRTLRRRRRGRWLLGRQGQVGTPVAPSRGCHRAPTHPRTLRMVTVALGRDQCCRHPRQPTASCARLGRRTRRNDQLGSADPRLDLDGGQPGSRVPGRSGCSRSRQPRPRRCLRSRNFLVQNGTLFLLATGAGASASWPLVAAFMEDLTEVARHLAAGSTGARLDPPLLLALDEIGNLAPLPSLPVLMAEGGGTGITTMPVLQSLSQARNKWGDQQPAHSGTPRS